MKILFRTVGTLSGVGYQMHEEENEKEFFEALETIQETHSKYFDDKKFEKYEELFDIDSPYDSEYIMVDNKKTENFVFHWETPDEEPDSNFRNVVFLNVPKVFLEEYFDTKIELVLLSTD